jgi:hypothetical protein
LAKALTWLAAAVGLGFVLVFLAQAGLFTAMLPQEPEAPPPARAHRP